MTPSTADASVPTWSCALCPNPKPATWCSGCEREKATASQPNHYVATTLTEFADVIVVTEAPVLPKLGSLDRIHVPYSDDGGRIVTETIKNLKAKNPALANLTAHFTYVVHCTANQGDKDASKDTVDRCRGFLIGALEKNKLLNPNKHQIVLAVGLNAVKALGIKAAKLKDVQSRVFEIDVNGIPCTVFPTLSVKQLIVKAGLFRTFETDCERALTRAATRDVPEAPPVPLEIITKGFTYPKTIDDVRKLCDEIINYSEDGVPPEQWAISVDTETNTKFPHRANLKVLCVSFAWSKGKAAAIPLWHSETPYDPKDALPYIRAVLESKKPKIFHNYKFDYKVLKRIGLVVTNFSWDTMLGEHGLEEDKKGLYGLKPITTQSFPEYAGYADKLQELHAKQEGDSQLDNLRHHQQSVIASKEEPAPAPEADQKKKKKEKKKKGEDSGGFEKIPLTTLLPYAAIDTDLTRSLAMLQLTRIGLEQRNVDTKRQRELRNRFRKYEVPNLCNVKLPVRQLIRTHVLPVTPVLARMELRGIRVDRPYLETLQNDLGKIIADTEVELYKMIDNPQLKLNHAKSIADVLFNVGFLHPVTGERTVYPAGADIGRTKKGQIQTTEKVMKHLVARYQCPFSTKKLIYAKAFKAKNTFCKNVWDLSALDGFLHTNYHQHGTGTGRLSSSDENMQNIPKKLSGFSIKKIFIPSDDSLLFVNADAKGAEVRIFTAYSRDPALIKSLNEGEDTHCFIASQIVALVRQSPGAAKVLESMGLDDTYPLTYVDFAARDQIKQTTPKYGEMLDRFRTAVKRVVFGILYGAGPAKIAETIGISLQQAKVIIDMLFAMFPSIPRYMEQTKWELRTFGYVETYFGRRRRFEVAGAAKYQLGRAERQGVNFKIQSTSSEIVLDLLAALEQPLERDLGGRLLLTVHDSIGFEAPKKYASQLPDFIKTHLEDGAAKKYPWLPVAFKWDYEVGPSYGELKPLNAYLENLTLEEERNESQEAYTEEEVRTALAADEA